MPLTAAPKGGIYRIVSIDRASSGLMRKALGLTAGSIIGVVCHHPSPENSRLVEVEYCGATISLPRYVATGIEVTSIS